MSGDLKDLLMTRDFEFNAWIVSKIYFFLVSRENLRVKLARQLSQVLIWVLYPRAMLESGAKG